MNASLTHSYTNFRLHIYQALTRDGLRVQASYVRKLFDVADKAGKITLIITAVYIALVCFEKMAASATLAAHYCDLCAVLPVILVAP